MTGDKISDDVCPVKCDGSQRDLPHWGMTSRNTLRDHGSPSRIHYRPDRVSKHGTGAIFKTLFSACTESMYKLQGWCSPVPSNRLQAYFQTSEILNGLEISSSLFSAQFIDLCFTLTSNSWNTVLRFPSIPTTTVTLLVLPEILKDWKEVVIF